MDRADTLKEKLLAAETPQQLSAILTAEAMRANGRGATWLREWLYLFTGYKNAY